VARRSKLAWQTGVTSADVINDKTCGTEGTYNTADDGIDSADVAGSVAPLLKLFIIILIGLGLLVLGSCVWFRRRQTVHHI
jgi:hypothetical protein